MLKDAEAAKARVYDVSGMVHNNLNAIRVQCGAAVGIGISVDDDYLLVASHLEETTKQEIVNHEYVDFAKLLRRDRPSSGDEDDSQHMIMVNKGGMSYWVPAIDRSAGITSYTRWDQAFRVFLDVYTSRYPERTSELIEYSHIIQTALYSFAWENVYLYDREFCRHMERHPLWSWGVILQQAWMMFLKDWLNAMPSKGNYSNGQDGHSNNVGKKLCFGYNRGYCKFGSKCKFDHRCGFCGKFGHGAFNCRKANQTGGNANHNSGNGGGQTGNDSRKPRDNGGSSGSGVGVIAN